MTERDTWTQADTDAVRFYRSDRRLPSMPIGAGDVGYEPHSPAPRGLTDRQVNAIAILLLIGFVGAAGAALWLAYTGRIQWR